MRWDEEADFEDVAGVVGVVVGHGLVVEEVDGGAAVDVEGGAEGDGGVPEPGLGGN